MLTFLNARGNSVSPWDPHVCCLYQISHVSVAMSIYVNGQHRNKTTRWCIKIHQAFLLYRYIHTPDNYIDIHFQYQFPEVITQTVFVSMPFIQMKQFAKHASLHLLPSDTVVYSVHSAHKIYCLWYIMTSCLLPAKRKHGPDRAETSIGYIRYSCNSVS